MSKVFDAARFNGKPVRYYYPVYVATGKVYATTTARRRSTATRRPCANRTIPHDELAALHRQAHVAAVEQVEMDTENTTVLCVASATTGSVLKSSDAVVSVAAVAALAA